MSCLFLLTRTFPIVTQTMTSTPRHIYECA